MNFMDQYNNEWLKTLSVSQTVMGRLSLFLVFLTIFVDAKGRVKKQSENFWLEEETVFDCFYMIFKPILHNKYQNIEDNEESASQCSCKGEIKELKKEWKKEFNAMEKKINKLQV